MKNVIKKSISLLLAISTITLLSACGNNDYKDESIYYATTEKISTFDPQSAKTSAELSVATNCFEGLLTKDKNGKIVKGMAEEYTVEGLTYQFKIKDDLLWSDGETKITAADFAYGIKRALLKSTQSPYASLLFSIKNAKKVHSGDLKTSSLGVSYKDNILKINLSKKDDEFEETLTKPLCSPCNEEFFKSTNGKYGLSVDDIITNGTYKVSSYSEDTNTVKLLRDDDYKGNIRAIPQGINFTYSTKYEDIYSYFDSKDIDIGNIECDYLGELENSGYASKLFYNTNYVLYISNELKSTYGYSLAKALMLDIDTQSLKSNITGYYKFTAGIIPDSNTSNGEIYRDEVGDINSNFYNKSKAETLIDSYEGATDALSGLSIYYPKDYYKLKLISNLVAQTWQKDLNAYINTSEESVDNITAGIKSGDIQIAIIPISSEKNEADTSLNTLKDLGITNSVKGYSAKALFKEEKSLINNYKIMPLVSIPTALSYDSKIKQINFSYDGRVIDFRYAEKSK